MINLKQFIPICFFLVTISNSWCQNKPVSQLDSLAARLMLTVRAQYDERAYIKTDKTFYSVGETIWFRSFLINERTHKLASKSSMLFVDLVNEKDSVIEKIILSASQFKTDGHLILSDTLSTGFYWVRAYTKDISLHHPEQIGVQALYIINSAKPAERNTNNIQSITAAETNTAKLRMDFFPEGGSVIGGANTVIAFRITDDKGVPQKITGVVKDDHDSVVAPFSSNKFGLGKLSFFSWSLRKYEAHVITDGKPENIFALPKIDPFAAQLSVVENRGLKKLRVVLEDSIYKKDRKTYIIGISGDSLCFEVIGTGSYEVVIPESRLPYGVVDFLLFDEQQHLLSERKLFNSVNKLEVAIVPDKPLYRARQKVQLDISVVDADNRPVVSSLYINVIDSSISDKFYPVADNKQQLEALYDINQWTLMDRFYAADELDLLMLLQKRSFRQIINALPGLDRNQQVNNEIDSSFYVKGKISDSRGKPLENKIVTLFSGVKNIMAIADTTGKNGEFCFPLISYYDQTKFNLQVTDKKGFPVESKIKLDTLLHFPRFVTPSYLKQKFAVDGVKEFYTNQRKRSVQDTIIMGKDWLKEVIVRSTIKKPAEYNRDKRVSSFSKILSGKMLQNGGNNNIGDALFRIPGITMRNGQLVLRGGNGFHAPGVGGSGSNEPLLIVDGVPITPGGYDSMNPGSPLLAYLSTFDFRIVDFIEVLTGPEAAFYGSRAFNGVILIHTKTTQTDIGDATSYGIKSFTMPGYQPPVEFIQPDYSIKENRNSKFPDRRTHLYWNGDVITDEKGKVSLNFYTADQPARYYITVRGITADGRVVNKQVTIDRK